MKTGKKVQTIEKTGKGWKLQQVIAVLFLLGGIVYLIAAEGERSPVGGLVIGGGLIWLIIAKIGAWWCHG